MEVKTTNNKLSHKFTLDASNLELLNQQVDKILFSFPKCYIYKSNIEV